MHAQIRDTGRARVHITKGDHGGRGRDEKERKLVDEITHGRMAVRAAFVYFGGNRRRSSACGHRFLQSISANRPVRS